MSAPATIAAGYLESLLAGQPKLPASPLAWLNKLRAEAVDRVGVLTVPTLRDEEWRFTDISPLTKLSFHPASEPTRLQPADIEHFYIEEATTRLVFVDGVYAPQLSSAAADAGVVVANLATAATPLFCMLVIIVEVHSRCFTGFEELVPSDGSLVQ